jgi:hypothetical protein
MQKGPYFQPVQYISPLPEGYMQASANIGRSLGGALASIGETIGTSLEKYRKNKEEDQLLTQQAEAIVPNLQAYAGDIKDEKQKASFEGLIKKLGDFSGQSLSQKRATFAQAATTVQSFKNARDARVSAMQLNAAQQAVTNQNAYTESLGGATTRDVSREVPMSGLIDQSRYLYNAAQNQPPASQPDFASIQAMNANAPQPSSAPIQAPQPAPIPTRANQAAAGQISNAPKTAFGNPTWRDTNTYPDRPDNVLSRASENLAYGAVDSLMDANAAAKWLAKTSGYTSAVIKASGIADKLANVNYSPSNPTRREDILAAFSGSPQPSAESISAMSAQSPTAGPSPVPTSVQAQAPQIAQTQPAAVRRPALPSALQFEQTFNQGIGELPAQTSKRTVTETVDLSPKEIYTNQLNSYISKGGKLTPELNAQFKKDAGVHAPVDIKVREVKSENGTVLGSMILEDGGVKHFMASTDSKGQLTQEQMLKYQENIQARMIDFNGQKFLSPTTDEAKEFRLAKSNQEDINRQVGRLIELNEIAGVKMPITDAYNEAKSIAILLQGSLRLPITGPGAVNAFEYKNMADVIADPTNALSLGSSNKKKLETLLGTTNAKLSSKAKSLGFIDATNAKFSNGSESNQPITKKDSSGRSYTIQRF